MSATRELLFKRVSIEISLCLPYHSSFEGPVEVVEQCVNSIEETTSVNAGNFGVNYARRIVYATAGHGSGQATGQCTGNAASRNRDALANVKRAVYFIRAKMARNFLSS
ncbi:hypothetical protein ACH5RR_012421 [Cinchona calisaya]|uniref:Uncharacterized protein n=1 Tax=Cinchona calisaya TaxID=153742 RepID=A0ABD3A7K9_9GENT